MDIVLYVIIKGGEMKEIQEKFETEKEAISRAEELAKKYPTVQVVKSKDGYYVETECHMIRIWERLIWTKTDGRIA